MSFLPRALIRSVAAVAAPGGTPKISTLVDNFATDDAAKWSHFIVGTATYAVTSGQGVSTLVNAAGTNSSGVESVATYDLTGSRIFFRYATSSNTGVASDDQMRLYTDANNWVRWNRTNGTLQLSIDVATAVSVPTSATYVPATHAWLSIKEVGGTITFETAPSTASNPPIAGDWVSFGTVTTATMGGGFTANALKVRIYGSTFTALASPGAFAFDGVNGAT